MSSRGRLLAGGVVLAGLAFLFLVDPQGSALYPRCPFLALTGLECAGCGSARALHALLHGDLAAAFALNPLVVVSSPFLAYAALGILVVDESGRRRLPRIPLRTPLVWGVAAAVPLLAVLRWIG